MASSSSAASSSSILEKYDVFISFRGEDTRRNFTSQLHHALCQKKIKTFIDSYDLVRGENISQALLQAIEESTVWVIIFSENYASSRWCLDELVEIVKCMNMNKKNTRIAIPVFYNVDPSHVRHQSGSYEKYKDNNIDKAEEWKVALTTTANLSGWDTKSSSTDVELIKTIVEDVLKKLSNLHPFDSKLSGLVGIEERIVDIELLIGRESTDVCMIGIWGMGGIGKTTIAGALYNKLSGEYNGSCFVQNVREEMEKHGIKYVRNQFFSKLLGGEKVDIDTPDVESTWVIKRLQRMKCLIVLDDVSDSSQLDDLVKNHNWFGKGSRIIVTTRDKQVIDKRAGIYEVKELKFDEAHQLFCARAFQRNEPPVDYMELCHRAIEYAKGVPLALKVLGSLLFGTSMDEWKSALDKLKEIPNEDIQKVLRLSYDSLDQKEKDIFLDIVHFFKGERKDYVKGILDGCGFYADIGIKRLLDKSLIITEPYDRINMHDLVKEMGLNVVREKYLKEPQSRSRLNDHEEICHVLNNNKGTEAIEGIWLDDKMKMAVRLRPDVFANMQKLRILSFDVYNMDNEIGVYCSKAFKLPDAPRLLHWREYPLKLPDALRLLHWREYPLKLPDALRLLHWRKYPLKSLPSSFCPKELVSLSLEDSKIQELWNGVQELPNLEMLDLEGCVNLIKVPNLSRAPSLKTMDLSGCSRLVSVPSSIKYLQKLVSLSLFGCERLRSIPPIIHLSSLSSLDLAGCRELKEFSVTSDTMKSLYLTGTAIKEIHPSICRLHTLVKLDLHGCSYISEIPDDLMRSLVSLEDLILGFTNIQSIPASIKNLSRLRGLFISDCKRLESLPQLPSSLKRLAAERCRKLEIVPSSTLRMISQDWNEYNREPSVHAIISRDWRPYNDWDRFHYSDLGEGLSFLSCKKLDQKALEIIEAEAKLSIHRVAYLSSRKRLEGVISEDLPGAKISLPGKKIPEWFSYRTTGSSITIRARPSLINNHNFLGFAFCHANNIGCYAAINCQCHVYFGEEFVHSQFFHEVHLSNYEVQMIYNSYINFQLVEKLKELFSTRYTTFPFVTIHFLFTTFCIRATKKTGVKLVWVQERLLQGEPQNRMERTEDN
ncbi:Disease resistance protein (TIR-NBS-LRR class) [Quillaja saponaria]|uniref:ADP-ribosyl cyclase/cyclic ADP-ribose hydrolase n=1 Tax=Quillaja saponaria TaxID=32244 RepID=A0AAD7PPA7_QUISA|nr:Disease resistance protein (TIR-NBS-LRR class) [Quillaja saponaria]